MTQMYHLCWLGLLVVIYSGSCFSASHEDAADDSAAETAASHSRVKRGGWSMFRLGRGLQMLRLGKRGMPTIRLGKPSSDDNDLTPEEARFILASMIEDSKSISSRQVPVPRYGKDLDFQTAYEQGLADEDQKIMRRSAGQVELEPRLRTGGRFRRSTLSQFSELYQKLSEKLKELQNTERAVALPRIGRLSKERAVPIPRIG